MKLGKNFLLGIVDEASGAFMPLAFSQSCSYTVTNKLVEVSSPLVGGYDNYRKKTTGWTMKHEGLIGDATLRYTYKGVQYDFISLISTFAKSGEPMLCRWHENDEIKQGLAIVKSVDEVGSVKALAKVSVSLQGTGELKDLDPNNLEGAFAYVISSRSLLLYTISRPIAGFTPFVGNVSATTTWDPVESSRVQQFEPDDNLSFNVTDTVTAVRVTTAQHGVSFVNSTTLHVVLLQTEERDEQQQLHRYVQPLWWGGYALGDMRVKNTGNVTLFTLPTAGKTGSADRIEVDPSIDILSPGELHIDITGNTGQTAHCCDRTTSLLRTLRMVQTQLNAGDSPYMGAVAMEPAAFSCQSTVWGNDGEGAEVFNVSGQELPTPVDMDTTLPDALHLHWQMTGLGVDEPGPYTVQRELVSDMELHDAFYAYDATGGNLRVWCPSQVLDANVMAGGVSIYVGRLYDLDSEGNRVPVTISGVSAFSELSAGWGNYRFIDVSSLTMVSLMAQPLPAAFVVDKLPLSDIVLYAADEITELARVPMLTTPGTAVASVPEITNYTFARMADGAVQSLTTRQCKRDVVVATRVVQTQSNQWTVTASLIAISTGSAAYLPGALTMKWPGISETLVIPAGAASANGTLSGNPSWNIPTATLDDWASGSFFITPGSTVDVTPANWKAYKLGTINGKDLYDVQYAATAPGNLSLTSDSFTGTDTFIGAGEGIIANHLMRVNAGDTPTMQVRKSSDMFSTPATVTFTDTMIITDQPVELWYWFDFYERGFKIMLSNSADKTTPHRQTNIAEVLPYMRCRNSQTQAAIYGPAALAGLKPGAGENYDYVVQYTNDLIIDSDGVVEFCTAPQWGAPTIPVGNNLPGVVVYPYSWAGPLPKA